MAFDLVNFAMSGLYGAVFILPLVMVLVFKDRMPYFPGRKVIRMLVHRLKDGEQPDENGNITDEQLTVVKDRRIWKIDKKKVPFFWVETKVMKGFAMDYKAFACVREVMGDRVLRVWEKIPGLDEGDNYVPIDLPPEVAHTQYRADLSVRGSTMVKDISRAYARGKQSNLWLETVLPVLSMMLMLLVVIFGFDFMSNTLQTSADTFSAATRDSATMVAVSCGGVPDDFIIPSITDTRPGLNNTGIPLG